MAKKSIFKVKPNMLTLCILLCGGNKSAGVLLWGIVDLWKGTKGRMQRLDKDWLDMPAANWALKMGLSESTFRCTALPKVRKFCGDFIAIKQMKKNHKAPKTLWVSLDPEALAKALIVKANVPICDIHFLLNGLPGFKKPSVADKPTAMIQADAGEFNANLADDDDWYSDAGSESFN